MNIGFTGTRDGMTQDQIPVFHSVFNARIGSIVGSSFHHGSCKGADIQAAKIIKRIWPSITVIGHPGPPNDPCQEDSGVDDEVRPPKNHFARNRDIVDETDELIACPKDSEAQPLGGTWYTVKYAQKKNKKVTIIWPNGEVETFPRRR